MLLETREYARFPAVSVGYLEEMGGKFCGPQLLVLQDTVAKMRAEIAQASSPAQLMVCLSKDLLKKTRFTGVGIKK